MQLNIKTKRYYIVFKSENHTYAIEANQLLGTSDQCPFISYPGLPEKIIGITHFRGKIFPVFNFFNKSTTRNIDGCFLFIRSSLDQVGLSKSSKLWALWIDSKPTLEHDLKKIESVEILNLTHFNEIKKISA